MRDELDGRSGMRGIDRQSAGSRPVEPGTDSGVLEASEEVGFKGR